MESVKSLLKKLTLSEKVSLLVGKDFWHTNGINRFGLPSIVVSDGPFGLRKVVDGSNEAFNASLPATAFPTSSALASTWDDDLLKEVGLALASECMDQGVDILLGPGLNIKRNPLCGRNFEYFSEDPYLSGRLALALVKAIEGQGVGTSVKHFAANNQEEKRLTMNAIIDERALFEIYLKGFEMVIKEGKPMTVMCSYNQINGRHASRNPYILKDILRNRFGYKGLVVSDWGAVVDLADSVKAGLNLEMPGAAFSSRKLAKELHKKGVTEAEINEAISPLLEIMLKKKYNPQKDYKADYVKNHRLAIKAASEAAVLLKNDADFLPIEQDKRIALIGAFARKPRYQGSGSSRINPRHLEGVYDAFVKHQVDFEFADGYSLKYNEFDEEKIKEAINIAKDNDYVVLMIGLPEAFEMEGEDREHLELPASHNELVKEIVKVNPNVIVVLSSGSPVLMPWINDVKAVLHMHLAGQGSGEALYQLLYGLSIPSGKLTETYPLKLEDVPSYNYFANGRLNVEYRESIYVGYRYYTKAKKAVLFPFGFGLSYTTFSYSDLEVSHTEIKNVEKFKVSVRVKNTGKFDAKEIVQVYVGLRKDKTFNAPINLVNYKKVFIKQGEELTVDFVISKKDFSTFDTTSKTFRVEKGAYKIYVGPNSNDLKLSRQISIDSDFVRPDLSNALPSYYELDGQTLDIPLKEFCTLYGTHVRHYRVSCKRPFTKDNTLNDASGTIMGRFIIRQVTRIIKSMTKDDPLNEKLMLNTFLDMPIRSYASFSSGIINKRQVKGIVNILNLRLISGLVRLIPGRTSHK